MRRISGQNRAGRAPPIFFASAAAFKEISMASSISLGRAFLAVAAALCLEKPATAQIFGRETADVVLAKEQRTPGVTWSKESTLTDAGLVLSKTGEFWLQSPRVSAGLAWRPPTRATVTVPVHADDAKEFPQSMRAYVRFGCDGAHWSTWQVMAESKAEGDGVQSYQCTLGVPSVARERYTALRYKWYETHPNWSSDEDALCRWIAQEEPRFFEKELPLIGYVQFRLEDYSGARDVTLTKLTARASWGVGGRHTVPKQGKPDCNKKRSFVGP
jgi:hypothetical protein